MDMMRYFAMGVEDADTYYPIGETMGINEAVEDTDGLRC